VPEDHEIRSVDDLLHEVRDLLEGEYGEVWVSGELGQFTLHRSGHLYATLKGQEGSLSLVAFKSTLARSSGFRPEEGARLIVRGYLSLYVPGGRFQLIAQALVPAGRGDLLAAIEERKRRLAAEGLFDEGRKRPLPALPRWIGVVTSPDGAAIRDFVLAAWARWPARILLAPATVQGERAPAALVAALTQLGQVPEVDVVVLTRGGGSAEALAAFSDEAVVRAVAACPVPVVSAVGHEVDWVLTDLAADWRAATPTAAGERVVPVHADWLARVGELERLMAERLRRRLSHLRADLKAAEKGLQHPATRLHRLAVRLEEAEHALERGARLVLRGPHARLVALADRLGRRVPTGRVHGADARLLRLDGRVRAAAQAALRRPRERLREQEGRLRALDPRAVLARGYSITRDARSGAILRSVADAPPGTPLLTRVADGELCSTVEASE